MSREIKTKKGMKATNRNGNEIRNTEFRKTKR